MEQTLIILKPDTVQRGIVWEIISRFERAGFKIVAAKMVRPNHEHFVQHYEGIGTLKTRKGIEIFDSQVAAMQDGPVIALVLQGVEAVETVRSVDLLQIASGPISCQQFEPSNGAKALVILSHGRTCRSRL